MCKARGVTTEATEVDHIEAHKGDTRKFFDRRNLQSLCKPDHSAKTRHEMTGCGYKGSDSQGYPADPEYRREMERYS